MERQSVESSYLKSVAYDAAAQVLEIEFHRGGMYRFAGVPPAVFQDLLRAESPGRYFRAFIEGHYEAHRLN